MFDTLTRMGAAGAGGAYEIERSLRFEAAGGSIKLDRTFGTNSSDTTKTLSFWMKLGVLGGTQTLFATTSDGYIESRLDLLSDQTLQFNDRDSGSGTSDIIKRTNRVFRDPNAWYHIVLILDTTNGTAADRVRLYTNGVRETSLMTDSSPAQNYAVSFNRSSVANFIGANNTNNWSSVYLAEIHFLDGTIKEPDKFGETNADTGQWVPIKYTDDGYGTNGFYLNFSDNSNNTAGTIGNDSANSNDWTPTNVSVSAGGECDSVTDTPTNNHATLTPLKGYGTTFTAPTNGGLDYSLGGLTNQLYSSIAVGPSGKWYLEVTATTAESGRYMLQTPEHTAQWDQAFAVIPQSDVREIKKGSTTVYSSITSISNGDIIGIALDCDNNTAQAYMNGTSLGAAFSLDTVSPNKIYHFSVGRNSSGGGSPAGSVNFGQRPFSNQPTGFEAWSTANLPEPTIKKPTDYFNTVLYTSTASAGKTVTGVGFSPNLFWAARRNGSGASSQIYDTVRGVGKGLDVAYANDTEVADGVTSFDADGVTLGATWPNASNGDSWVAWNWKESATAGFDMFSYTGTGSNPQTRAHSLGVTPEMMIVKSLDSGESDQHFVVYHHKSKASPEDYFGRLNTDAAFEDLEMWNDTAPTSSIFTTQNHAVTNYNGSTFIAYLWASVEGYSKVGSYEGIGGTDGPYVSLGFKPAWVMIKNVDSGSRNWIIKTAKIPGYNVISPAYAANSNAAEVANESALDFLSNGFKIRNNGSYTNENGSTHIYLAFAEAPFKYANAR